MVTRFRQQAANRVHYSDEITNGDMLLRFHVLITHSIGVSNSSLGYDSLTDGKALTCMRMLQGGHIVMDSTHTFPNISAIPNIGPFPIDKLPHRLLRAGVRLVHSPVDVLLQKVEI